MERYRIEKGGVKLKGLVLVCSLLVSLVSSLVLIRPISAELATPPGTYSSTGYVNYVITSQTASANPSSENFIIIALPDTQNYSKSYPWIFENQTEWIVQKENENNIVFATHLGDIVQHYYDEFIPEGEDPAIRWQNADAAMGILDEKVLYGILPGNHDLGLDGGATYESYFPPSRYSYWDGSYVSYSPDSNLNNYQLFSAGGMNFIAISLQHNPPDDVLNWADNVLDNYSNRRAIISTHYYLIYSSGERSAIGTRIYDNLVVPHNNVFLVLCGHNFIGNNGEREKIDTLGNRTVYQLLSDYQGRPNGGNGWLRIMKFVPSEDKIYVRTYSPYLDQYETDSDSQFELTYPMLAGLAAPTLQAPANGSLTNNNRPTFRWAAVADLSGVTYTLQIDNENTFTSPHVYENAGMVDNTCTLPNENALVNGTYYWRVRAVDGAGNIGNWSEVWQFTVDTTPPPTPALLSPPNGSSTKDSTPTFEWTSVYDPSGVTYTLDYMTNNWLKTLTRVEGITGSAYTVPDNKAFADNTYYWRVRAVDGAGNVGNWSKSWWFRVKVIPVPPGPVPAIP